MSFEANKLYASLAIALIAAGAYILFRGSGGRIDPAKNPAGAAKTLLKKAGSADGKKMLPSQVVIELRANNNALNVDAALLDQVETKADTDGQATIMRPAIAGCRSMAKTLGKAEELRRTSFDNSDAAGEAMLKTLWSQAFPDGKAFDRPSEEWSKMGFQGLDPITDLRGGGMLALQHLVNLSQNRPKLFREMIAFNADVLGAAEHHWFLTAVVSIQFSVQLLSGEHPLYPAHLELLYAAENARAAAQLSGGSMPEKVVGGISALHGEMMELFFAMWKQDKPHVMEYTQWLPKFHKKFFSPEWKPVGVSA